MKSTLVIAPITSGLVTAPVVVPSSNLKKCVNPNCTRTFLKGNGYVPAWRALYKDIRGTSVRMIRPLTGEEIASRELCFKCRKLATFRTFRTSEAIATMERVNAENELHREEAEKEAELRHIDYVVEHDKDLARKHINRELEERATRDARLAKRYKKGRKHAPKPSFVMSSDPTAHKNYGDGKKLSVSAPTSNNGKKKDGGKSGTSGRKNR